MQFFVLKKKNPIKKMGGSPKDISLKKTYRWLKST